MDQYDYGVSLLFLSNTNIFGYSFINVQIKVSKHSKPNYLASLESKATQSNFDGREGLKRQRQRKHRVWCIFRCFRERQHAGVEYLQIEGFNLFCEPLTTGTAVDQALQTNQQILPPTYVLTTVTNRHNSGTVDIK